MKYDISVFAILFVACFGFVSGELNITNDSIEVYTSLYATQEWAQIDLNVSEIDFGWINLSATTVDQKRKSVVYWIKNRGNINITVTPILNDESDSIFKNIYFSSYVDRSSVTKWKQIGDNYNISLNATENGAWTENRFAIHLKLDNYVNENGPIPFDIIDHNNAVIFEVLPRYD